ncbi:MAG: glycosyltransferase [Romboutsia sp.]
MSKVSLIVPVYNSEEYLKRCIDSLISQTLNDIEIIVINDGSTDCSEKIIKGYNDKRIVYYKQENKGIGETRNKGINIAKGEYLAFVDSDDYIKNTFCEKMYSKAVKNNCDLIICDYYEVRNELKEIKFNDFNDTSLKNNPSLINNINLGPCNKIYNKKLFKNCENRFVINLKYEDAPFVCKILLEAKKIGKINECLTYYVIHENSETTRRDKKIFDILKITEIIIKNISRYDYMKEETINLVVMILTDYTIQQRYIDNNNDRNKFIDEAFLLMNKLDNKWRKCNYLKKFKM